MTAAPTSIRSDVRSTKCSQDKPPYRQRKRGHRQSKAVPCSCLSPLKMIPAALLGPLPKMSERHAAWKAARVVRQNPPHRPGAAPLEHAAERFNACLEQARAICIPHFHSFPRLDRALASAVRTPVIAAGRSDSFFASVVVYQFLSYSGTFLLTSLREFRLDSSPWIG